MRQAFGLDIPAKKPRTRKDMIAYLKGHYRYNGRYSHKVKIDCLNRPEGVTYMMVAEALDVQEAFVNVRRIIREFSNGLNGSYDLCFEGRSGGYISLFGAERTVSQYKSYCEECGQKNYRKVIDWDDTTPEGKLKRLMIGQTIMSIERFVADPLVQELALPYDRAIEIVRNFHYSAKEYSFGNACGRCGEDARVNATFYEDRVYNSSLDDCADFDDKDEWTLYDLRDRVDLIWNFDLTVIKCIAAFMEFASTHQIVDKVIYRPETIRVAVPR